MVSDATKNSPSNLISKFIKGYDEGFQAGQDKAADLITELVAALEPFGDLRVSRFMTDGLKYDFRIDAGHIRRAAAALARARSKGE